MSDYISTAIANEKRYKVDKIMEATYKLVMALGTCNNKKVWAGYRKKLRRIL